MKFIPSNTSPMFYCNVIFIENIIFFFKTQSHFYRCETAKPPIESNFDIYFPPHYLQPEKPNKRKHTSNAKRTKPPLYIRVEDFLLKERRVSLCLRIGEKMITFHTAGINIVDDDPRREWHSEAPSSSSSHRGESSYHENPLGSLS